MYIPYIPENFMVKNAEHFLQFFLVHIVMLDLDVSVNGKIGNQKEVRPIQVSNMNKFFMSKKFP